MHVLLSSIYCNLNKASIIFVELLVNSPTDWRSVLRTTVDGAESIRNQNESPWARTRIFCQTLSFQIGEDAALQHSARLRTGKGTLFSVPKPICSTVASDISPTIYRELNFFRWKIGFTQSWTQVLSSWTKWLALFGAFTLAQRFVSQFFLFRKCIMSVQCLLIFSFWLFLRGDMFKFSVSHFSYPYTNMMDLFEMMKNCLRPPHWPESIDNCLSSTHSLNYLPNEWLWNNFLFLTIAKSKLSSPSEALDATLYLWHWETELIAISIAMFLNKRFARRFLRSSIQLLVVWWRTNFWIGPCWNLLSFLRHCFYHIFCLLIISFGVSTVNHRLIGTNSEKTAFY